MCVCSQATVTSEQSRAASPNSVQRVFRASPCEDSVYCCPVKLSSSFTPNFYNAKFCVVCGADKKRATLWRRRVPQSDPSFINRKSGPAFRVLPFVSLLGVVCPCLSHDGPRARVLVLEVLCVFGESTDDRSVVSHHRAVINPSIHLPEYVGLSSRAGPQKKTKNNNSYN